MKPFPFTEATLKALDAPASGRVYHKDSKAPGLQVCVTSTGTKTFYYVRRMDGKPTRVRLGTIEELSVKAARDLAAKKAAAVADGRNPQAERRQKRLEPDLQALYDHWTIYASAHKKPLSAKYDGLNWGKHLSPWSTRRLSSIKKSDVQALHAEIGRTCGPYAANRVLALLRAMYNKAEEIGWKGENPANKVKAFKEVSRDRFLHPDELERFFAALQVEKEIFRDFFLLCLLTGARKNNVQTMRWADLDMAAGYWRIPETKGGTVVVVPLVAPALAILRTRQEAAGACPWVFPGHRRNDYLREPREAWARICTTAGLHDLHVHDLRRSLGSWMAGQNTSLPIIGRMLGHSTPQATLVYARLASDVVRQAAERATAAILTAGGRPDLLEGPKMEGNP
jgi:integrase